MAKQKNTVSKKKHTKLMNQKKTKKQLAKDSNKLRLKKIIKKANEWKD
ncbi:MAG: hypothetical protein ACJAXI_003019 [Crocinitomicaceae bacterium]|jgi:hypothetical protein